ncbi:ribonuclease H-like domain-containing protein [Tanacetum coccineum]
MPILVMGNVAGKPLDGGKWKQGSIEMAREQGGFGTVLFFDRSIDFPFSLVVIGEPFVFNLGRRLFSKEQASIVSSKASDANVVFDALINNLDAGNPLHMNPNDSANTTLIPFKLLGIKNYRIWASAMKLALQARNKFAFVDGSCIMNSVSSDVYMGLVYIVDAASVWKELESIYDKVDGSRGIPQEESHKGIPESTNLTESKLNATSFAAKSFNTNKRNNNASNSRGSTNFTNNRGPNPNLLCKNYGMIGHTIKRCYELIGYPPGFKKVSNPVKQSGFKQNFNANVDVKNDKQNSSTFAPASFISEHMRKLLNLINETPTASIHANVAGWIINSGANQHLTVLLLLTNNIVLYDVLVVPGYCVSLLYVNKLIKDSKLFVGFDEDTCYIQDLKRETILGTGSKSGRLYMFNMDNDTYVGMPNLVMSFNVSKDLSKQTREPFPLSYHKSEKLGELIHLDLWGPYKGFK